MQRFKLYDRDTGEQLYGEEHSSGTMRWQAVVELAVEGHPSPRKFAADMKAGETRSYGTLRIERIA